MISETEKTIDLNEILKTQDHGQIQVTEEYVDLIETDRDNLTGFIVRTHKNAETDDEFLTDIRYAIDQLKRLERSLT